MAMQAEEVAQILYQAGARGDVLVNMVAIAGRESRYNPQAHRTDNPGGNTGDYGLFQINYVNYPTLQRALGLKSINDLLNPVTNAKAAMYLYGQSGYAPWKAAQGGFNAGGDPFYGTNRQAAQAAVTRAQTQGLLGKNWSGGMATAPNGTGTPAAGAAGGPFTLPPDAKLYNNGFTVMAVFDVGGVKISYDVNWFDGSVQFDQRAVTFVSAQQFQALNTVHAGNAEELRNFTSSWKTYKDFFSSIVNQVFGPGNEAKNDPEVLRVLAEFAGRPDMSMQELNNKLQATQWYQTRTSQQLEWNSLSDGERTKRTEEVKAQMAETWFQFTGEAVGPDDPRLGNYVEALASGKMGFGSWTENIVKKHALEIPESPWARQVNETSKAGKQPGVDIENTAQRVKDLARRWGVTLSDATAQQWGRDIFNADMSEADVLAQLKAQAQVLFPWKDPEMETSVAASPWVETYKRVMESEADMMHPKVQQAMSGGMNVWDFEQSLKKSSGWLNTRNAREEMVGTVAEAGRRLGFQ
jgi:Transglycosylase SLT domain